MDSKSDCIGGFLGSKEIHFYINIDAMAKNWKVRKIEREKNALLLLISFWLALPLAHSRQHSRKQERRPPGSQPSERRLPRGRPSLRRLPRGRSSDVGSPAADPSHASSVGSVGRIFLHLTRATGYFCVWTRTVGYFSHFSQIMFPLFH